MRTKLFAALALCCWASPPTLLDTYRETMTMAKECSHLPPACQSRPFHEQRLVVDEHCPHTRPKCVRVEDCFRKHVEEAYTYCHHAPACPSPLGHFNAVRAFQGLPAITLP